MKKFFSFFCAFITLLNLTGCNNSSETESGDRSGSEPSVSSQSSSRDNSSDTSDISNTPGGEEFVFTEDDLPRMDGSTSATPLEIGLKSGFLNIPYADAKELVSHTTTHDSFKRLINGEVDMIFSVPISAEQQKAADDAGVKLIMKPVAREGFVFVVNAQNPVDGLTSEQLRKIYSGEITNWKEVGGNDEPIIPYQRNTDSGSQNYMTVFMGDTPLLKPESKYIALGMGGLMDAVAVYDNSAGAIGYSVYSYAAQMYENANKVKFIAIDGVKPSKATMADESYPLLSNTYIIYTDKSPESAKKFTEAALSDKGQTLVLESGYLPVNGMDVPEKYLPYEAKGTGKERPADFKPSDKYSWFYGSRPGAEGSGIKKSGKYFEVVFLKDEALQSRVNADIRAAMDRLRAYELPKAEREYRETYGNDEFRVDGMDITLSCRNGYMSILIGYIDTSNCGMTHNAYFNAETINYELFSGRRIERYSELFYKDEDFLFDVNLQFNESAQRMLWLEGKKLDYSGILGEPRLFTIDGIVLEPDNLYFDFAPDLSYNDEFRFHSPVTEYRDMKPLVLGAYADKVCDMTYDNEWETVFVEENGDVYERVIGSPFHTAEEAKARDDFRYKLQKRAWETLREYDPEYRSVGTVGIREYDNHYSVGHFSPAVGDIPSVCFDKDSLEVITMEALIGKDWRQYIIDLAEDDKTAKLLPAKWFKIYNEDAVQVYTFPGGEYSLKALKIPADKFNKRYISTVF